MNLAAQNPEPRKVSETDETEAAEDRPSGFGAALSVPDHELIRCIGRGAYGQVWLARNVMGTYRAVKLVYRSNFTEDRPYEREFDGIKAFEPVSRTHDDLIDILQVGRNDAVGCFYYVMELADDRVSGQKIDPQNYEPKTLAAEVAVRGRLPWAECLELSLSLSGGLGHLHQHGLIHRDLKPSNIVFVNGIPKIADIGLVAAVGLPRSLVGTPGFIPPEGPGTVQADIFSLGKVFYEILSGKDRREFPSLAIDLPEGTESQGDSEFRQVILKACESDIRDRYASVEELRADLLLLQAGKSVRRLRLLERRLQLLSRVGLVAAVLLLLGAGAYYHVSQQRTLTMRSLAGSYVAYGTQLTDRNDLFGALPSFASALQLSGDHDPAAGGHRIRMGVVLRECPKLTQTYFTTGQINSVEFSADGRRLLTGGGQEDAVVWDTETGLRLLVLGSHGLTSHLETACFSPDGRRIMTTGDDHAVRLWDAATGAELGSVSPLWHEASLMSAKFSPDGDWIVTACTDGKVKIWRTGAREPLLTFKAHTAAVRYAVFGPEGRRVVTCSQDHTAKLWHLTNNGSDPENPFTWRHENWVYQAVFSPDGRSVATASYDGKAKIWDAETGSLRLTLDPHAPVRSVKISPDGRFIVTACWDFDFSTRLWNLASGEEVLFPFRHTAYATDTCFGPDGRRLAIAAANGVVNQWDLAGNAWQSFPEPVIYSRDGLCSAKVLPNAIEWVPGTDGAATRLPSGPDLRFMKLGPEGKTLLTISRESFDPHGPTNVVRLWNTRAGRPIRPPFPCADPVTVAAFSRNGSRLIIVVTSNACVCEAGHDRAPRILHLDNPIEGAGFNVRGTHLATWSGTNAVLWNADTADRIAVLPHVSEVGHAEFSPNDRYLVTCCRAGELQKRYAELWDGNSGVPFGIRLWHKDGVRHASFSKDGRRIVTASEDRSARVWETASGRPLTEPLVHRHQVMQSVFSPNGRWVVTRCLDNTVRVWDARSGTPVTHRLESPFRVGHVQFIEGGSRLFVSSARGDRWTRDEVSPTWRIWSLTPDPRPIDDLILFSQILSGRRGDQIGGGLALEREELQLAWTRLRGDYSEDFVVSNAEVLAWHRREANAARTSKDSPAAQFHLHRLIEALQREIIARPEDRSLLERRTLAESELSALNQAEPKDGAHEIRRQQ